MKGCRTIDNCGPNREAAGDAPTHEAMNGLWLACSSSSQVRLQVKSSKSASGGRAGLSHSGALRHSLDRKKVPPGVLVLVPK